MIASAPRRHDIGLLVAEVSQDTGAVNVSCWPLFTAGSTGVREATVPIIRPPGGARSLALPIAVGELADPASRKVTKIGMIRLEDGEAGCCGWCSTRVAVSSLPTRR